MKHTRRQRRRGGIYLVVMGVAMIVSVMGFSALMLQRIQRRSSQGSDDITQARLYAQAAVKMGMLRIENDPDWRYNFPNGVWESDMPIGNGTYTLEGVDPSDSDLTDAPEEPVVLTGTGKQGKAVQKMKITLAPANRGLGCLEVAMHAGDAVELDAVTLECDQTIGANNQVSASGATVNCNVEAVSSISGSTYNGTTTEGVDSRGMPDASTVFDYYKANGEWIDIDDIVAPSPIPPPSNLLTNPGMEDGVPPWAPWKSTTCVLERTTDRKYSATASLRVKDRDNFQAGPVQDIAAFVTSGVTYYCGSWVRMTGSNANAHFVIDVNSSGEGAQWWLSGDTYCREHNWIFVSGTITPTFTGTVNSATLKLETRNGDPVRDFYLDDAVLMKNPEPPPGPNLVAEGDMEGNPLSQWYGIGCSIATSTWEHSGVQAIQTTGRNNIADTFGQDMTEAIQNGASYYCEAWIRQSDWWTHFRLMMKLVSTGNGVQYIPLSPPVYAAADTYVKAHGETVISWAGDLTLAEFYVENLRVSDENMRLDDAVMIMSQPPPLPPHTIYRKVLSPSNNPYGSGATNAEGIYVIDCEGQDIHVERSRMQGTLVLLNAGEGSSIRSGPLNWSPAVANYPALLVEGDFDIEATDAGLSEYYEQTNFNPSGTPYLELSEDADQDDTLPSQIHGLIYATGSLSTRNRPVINGVVVAGEDIRDVYDNLDLTYQPTSLQNPPPGFNGPEEIRVLLGSVEKVVD